jgi:predicted aspartyl protease
MLKKIAAIAIIFLVTACGNWQMSWFSKKPKVTSSDFNTSVNFNFRAGVIIIPVIIKGQEYEFLFDTGASTSIISRDLAKAIGLKKATSSTNITDSNGRKRKIQNASVDSLSIAGITFTNTDVSIIDWPDNSAVECLAKDGIIGNNLIKLCNWIVDYKKGTLQFSDSPLTLENTHYLKMYAANYRPHFKLNLNGNTINRVLLDLGSGGSLDVGRGLVSKYGIKTSNFQNIQKIDGSSHGLFGTTLDTSTTILADSITIASLVFYNVPVELQRKRSCKIGNQILKKNRVVLDYSNERIGLVPYSTKSSNFGLSKSPGFSVSMNTNNLYVSSLTRKSKADSLGISYGDTLLTINGKSHEDFDDYCSFFDFLLNDMRKSDSLALVTQSNPSKIMVFDKNPIWKK